MFAEHLCRDCFFKRHSLVEEVRDSVVEKCTSCNRFRVGGKWISDLFSDDFKNYVYKRIKFGQDFEILSFIVNDIYEDKNMLKVKLDATARYKNKESEQFFELSIKENKAMCPDCTRIKSNYYTGILQLRGSKDNVFYADAAVRDGLSNEINKIVKVSNKQGLKGFDYYIIHKNRLRAAVTMLRKRFSADVKRSEKLVTQDKMSSKRVSRLTIYAEIPGDENNDK